MRRIRTLRHWKQRYDENAQFIFRKAITYAGKRFAAGDAIPDDLKSKLTKLRRFWEARTIELAEFEAPNVKTGVVDVVEALEVVDAALTLYEILRDGRNYLVGSQRFTSKKKAQAFIDAQGQDDKAEDTSDGSGADTVGGGTEDATGFLE